MSRQTALWGLAAVLGIVLTAGITYATSQLTSQHIGLSSEPISAGRGLAPRVAERSAPQRTTAAPKRPAGKTGTATSPAPSAPAATSPTVTYSPPAPSPGATSSGGSGGASEPTRTSAPRRRGSAGDDSRGGSGEAGTGRGGEAPRGRDD